MKKLCATLLSILFLCTPLVLLPQNGWYLCDGNDNNTPEIQTWQAFVKTKGNPEESESKSYQILMEVRVKYPSCPTMKDGFFEILSVYSSNSSGTTFRDIDFKAAIVVPVNNDPNNLLLIKSREIYNLGFTFVAMRIDVSDTQYATTTFYFPPSRLNRDKLVLTDSGNETCPGTQDGHAVLKRFDYGDDEIYTLDQNQHNIHWEDGFIGPSRNDLSAGSHKFQWRANNQQNICCLNGTVLINSNACYSKLLDESFTSQISGNWFINPPGSFVSNSDVGEFKEDGCVFIPFNLEPDDKAVSVKMDLYGDAEISIIDMQMNPLASKTISGNGNIQVLTLNESNIKGFYLKIAGAKGTVVDNLSLFRFEGEIEELQGSFNSSEQTQKSMEQEIVCVGEGVLIYDEVILQGGISPYSYHWDLNDDGIYQDADSLNHIHVFTNEGDFNLHLLVQDAIGQSDTLHFEYLAQESNKFVINIPELEIDGESINGLTVCQDAESFTLTTQSGEGELSSMSAGLQDDVFNPQMAGIGEHIIQVNGDLCDEPSVLFIDVIEEVLVDVDTLSAVYQCQGIVELNSLLSDPVDGIWFVNDTFPILNDTLILGDLALGSFTLSYETGADFCNPTYAQMVELMPMPMAELTTPMLEAMTDDPIIDLNSLLSQESSFGGSWSGTNVVDSQYFDPTGLNEGQYTVTYQVGEGACLATAELIIDVMMSTSVEDIHDKGLIEMYPNPAHDNLTICLKHPSPAEESIMRLYNTAGTLVLEHRILKQCDKIDINQLESGLYLLSVTTEGLNISIARLVKQ